ncbi:hypothetical protein DC094_07310 [Pelagibaculum spongiae]|uniref:Uncharacterized protein n=1 Tax=Pelagibaculum spongiae TaxID=2080658 RepID=A0A2V1GXM3_9GAMM|nr:hypothetical protein DC094_07310 [Pelagibaculum spongiae]
MALFLSEGVLEVYSGLAMPLMSIFKWLLLVFSKLKGVPVPSSLLSDFTMSFWYLLKPRTLLIILLFLIILYLKTSKNCLLQMKAAGLVSLSEYNSGSRRQLFVLSDCWVRLKAYPTYV